MAGEERAPDATSVLDLVAVGGIGVGAAAMVVGLIIIWWNRDYRPIKSKSVPLTLLSSLGGLIWILAALVVNGHFPRRAHSGLSICPLWTYWLQACFGFSLWLNCLTLRLFILFRIFICKRDGRGSYKFLVVLLAPVVGYCIAATGRKKIRFERNPDSDKGDCKFVEGTFWAYGLIALLVIYFLIFLSLAFKLRKTVSPLNEYSLIRRGGILSLFLFLLSMVTLQTRIYFEPVGRCLLSAAVASTIFYYFWARNGMVVYQVLFHKKEYLTKFMAELRRSPSHRERNASPSSFLKMEDQLIKIREEVQELRDQIKQLEDEVTTLEQNCTSMELVNSLK